MKRLQHEYITKFYEFYESLDHIIIILELICGGELYKRLKKIKKYKEKDAALLTHNLVLSLKYMHSQKIIHRDLKLENILLREKQNHVKIKLADFGLSTFTTNIELFKHCGTPGYIAPEVL